LVRIKQTGSGVSAWNDVVLMPGGLPAVHADNIRAAEVCSAEATELPVWMRPPVSVANGLCHPWALDHGSQAVMTRYVVWLALFQGCVMWCGLKRLDPGSSMRLPGMARYIVLFGLFRGNLSTFSLWWK